MGAAIKADDQKRRAMKISKEKQLLRSVLVHFVSALICALICSYSYWFPWLYCLTNHFVWIYLPSLWPVVTAPKYMFVVANAIVLVLVNEFKLTHAQSKNSHPDMYDEYVQRSRRAIVCRKNERKVKMIEDVKTDSEEKKVEIVEETTLKNFVVRKEEEIAEEIHEEASTEEKMEETGENYFEEENEETLESTGLDNFEDEDDQDMVKQTEAANFEEKNEKILEETSLINLEENKDQELIVEIKSDTCAEEKITTHDDPVAPNHNDSYDDQNSTIQEAEEPKADDELNKRVEDFIARVIRRRRIEANNWPICVPN